MLNVVFVERAKLEDMESFDDQLLATFSGTLFNWSRAGTHH